MQRIQLEDGDFIHMSSTMFVFMGGCILMSSSIRVNDMPYRDIAEQNSHLVYPQISRTSRFYDTPPTEDITVLDPPSFPEQQPRNMLITLLPTLIMAGLILVTRGGSSGGGMMMFSALSMGVGAVGSVLSYRENDKQNQKRLERREKTYLSYIKTRTSEIRSMRERERRILRSIYIEPEQELRNTWDFSADLFDRTSADTDFLDIRLGYGLLPSSQRIISRKHEAFEQIDALYEEPGKLARQFQFSEGLPAFIRAREANAIGFQGDFTSLGWMMNQTVLDLVTRHFPNEVSLYFLCGNQFGEQMKAYRMLPHLRGFGARRNIAHDLKSRDELLEELYRTLSQRESQAVDGQPWLVIFIYADDEIIRHPLLKFVHSAAKLHCVFLFWAQFREQIPQGCSYTVRLFTNEIGGVAINMLNREMDMCFGYARISNDEMRLLSERLAPVYTSETSLSSTLVSSLSLFDMLHINAADATTVCSQWAKADTCKSLAAPLGVIAGGQSICLDLHERAHGPHGLIAGTTGSGKSELLLSYVLSMAYHYSPNDVNFMIIDFKGGGMTTRLEGLPHLTGTITNLNKRDIERSRISIRAESLRRQKILSKVKAKDIYEYTSMLHAGSVDAPLPHLIIIVDEFAELKSQQPEFMDDLISTARIGRSLGIHLILATQKPAGVVNEQIWSNSDFKLCLRVQNKEDSNEVLHSPLAAEIHEPGRAYLQVSQSGILQLFQSGYGGIPVPHGREEERRFQLDKVTLSGHRERFYEPKFSEIGLDVQSESQFSALLREIISAFAASGLGYPRPICLPALPSVLPYCNGEKDDDCICIGVYDNPALQCKGSAVYHFALDNLLVVGGAQTGKTTLLQVIVRTAAENFTAREVNFYILDFNSGTFKMMERLSVVGGIVSLDQSERVRNLFKMLRNEVEYRKAKMSQYGVTSIRVYREISGDVLPSICVIIDNLAAFVDLYDETYGDELEILLRDGLAVGISFCVTVANGAQISSRRRCYFSERISLYQSDKNEYSVVLDGCRKELPEVAGRAFYRVEKEYLEMQVYTPFGETDDFERSKAVSEFVDAHSKDVRARAIPEVPAHLTQAFIREMFGEVQDILHYPYSMDYESVEPLHLNLTDQFELSLVGKNEEAREHFLEGLLKHMSSKAALGQLNIHIIDGFDRILEGFEQAVNVYDYSLDQKLSVSMVKNAYNIARERFAIVCNQGRNALDNMPLEVYIFNTREVIKSISGDSEAMSQFTEMYEQYRNMKVLFIFGDLENKVVSYMSPALLRHLRDVQQAILFEGLSTGRMFDIDSMSVRANKAILGRDDAFMIDDGIYRRIKLVW